MTEMSFMLLKSILLFFLEIVKIFTIKHIAIWIWKNSLSTNPPRKFNLKEDAYPLYNKLGTDRLRNHFHISSYPDPFSIDYISLNKMSQSFRHWTKIRAWKISYNEINLIVNKYRTNGRGSGYLLSSTSNVSTTSFSWTVRDRCRLQSDGTNARAWIIKLDRLVIRQTYSRQAASKSLCQSFPREWNFKHSEWRSLFMNKVSPEKERKKNDLKHNVETFFCIIKFLSIQLFTYLPRCKDISF